MIDPATIIFGVQGLIRLGTAARDAYEQKVREAPIPLIDLDYPKFDDDQKLRNVFEGSPTAFARIEPGGDLADCWAPDGRVKDDASRQRLYDEAIKIVGATGLGSDWRAIRFRAEPSALILAAQFKAGAEPPRPAVRLALAFADVALGYVAANPGLLGAGANGEKLIAALANNVRTLLPDVDNRADWQQMESAATFFFAERAFTIALEAGLQTVAENSQLIVEERHYQALLANVLAPLVEEFRTSPGTRPSLEQLRDTLLGPMAKAALATLYDNQAAFLGATFDPSRAVGALTRAAIGVARDDGLAATFSGAGLTRVYRAALGVAVEKPQLFFEGDATGDVAARDLLVRLGTVLKGAPVPFQGELAAELAAAALESLSANAPRLMRAGHDAWRGAGATLVGSVLDGLADGLREGGPGAALDAVFTRDEAVKLVNIFMTHAARTPGMIVGDKASPELQGIVAVFASSMAKSDPRIMTGEDWLAVAEAVIAEAAKNPMRLFAIADPGDPDIPMDKQLIAQILKSVLEASGIALKDGGRTAGTVLFGDTLREALTLTIRTAAGKSAASQENVAALGTLVARLNGLATANPGRVGAREWLALFEKHLPGTLQTGMIDALTPDKLLAELGVQTV